MGKQKQTWKHFVALWSRFGIEPQEASEILVKNWLEKNYTVPYGNIFRDKENRKDFNTERSLVKMVGKRKSLLSYLKAKDIERYRSIIKKLSIRK